MTRMQLAAVPLPNDRPLLRARTVRSVPDRGQRRRRPVQWRKRRAECPAGWGRLDEQPDGIPRGLAPREHRTVAQPLPRPENAGKGREAPCAPYKSHTERRFTVNNAKGA
jgi:hypothetical protein